MQQAELLSSLALKVNADNTEQSLENAWKVRSNFVYSIWFCVINIQCYQYGRFTISKVLSLKYHGLTVHSMLCMSLTFILCYIQVLQDFLNQSKENDIFRYTISDIDFQLEDFKDLLEDLRSSNEGSRPSWR